jgi:hypothetical protein
VYDLTHSAFNSCTQNTQPQLFPLPKTNIIYEDKRDFLYSQIITTNLLGIDKRRSKEEDEGGKTDNSGNREEGSTVITRVGGDQVGGGCGRLKNGTIDHHLWCFNGGGTVEGCSSRSSEIVG